MGEHYFVERARKICGYEVTEILIDVARIPYRNEEKWSKGGRPLLLSKPAARRLALDFKRRRTKINDPWDYRAVEWD